MHKSQDRTQRLVSTTETVSNNVREFQSITTCSSYTFTNHSEWSGDGYGIEEFDLNDGGYVPEIDN